MNNIKQDVNIDLILINDMYWDGVVVNNCNLNTNGSVCVIEDVVSIDINKAECHMGDALVSTYEGVWDGAVNNGVVLNHIGLTGIDNGLISYNKDSISNEEFLNILTKSKYSIEPNDYRLTLNPIRSNSKFYNYNYIDNGDYFSLKGGFFQGFYKLFGNDYSVLPNYVENEWILEFGLRPMDYDINNLVSNTIHPNNKGIFFYIGTRAENKFWELYDVGDLEFPFINRNNYVVNYVEDDYVKPINDVLTEAYLMCIEPEETIVDMKHNTIEGDNILTDWVMFNDNTDYIFPPLAVDNGCYLEEGYIKSPTDISKADIKSDDGYTMDKCNIYEMITDNKFLLFNQTKEGCTINNWKDGTSFKYTGIKTPKDINYFLLFNQTKDGYTTKTIQEYLNKVNNTYNPIKDITNNAFGLRVNENGGIGYRYLVSNEDCDLGYSIIEEYSKDGLIKNNEWVDVKVKIKSLQNNNCSYRCNQKIKLYFYLDNNLIFISKELPMFNFRMLDDISEKQEGVPYNLSLGGGTVGLMERVWLGYYNLPYYILPLEENFSGSFIGDISYFNFKLGDIC